jgi:hypothetical protein
MTYTVAKITTPDGVQFTARQDSRTPKEVVAQGIAKVVHEGVKGGVYESLYNHKTCTVDTMKTGLTEDQAKALKKAYIMVYRTEGHNVLNSARND